MFILWRFSPSCPWGVWSDGERLVVTDTREGRILVWESFPSGAGDGPDHVTLRPAGVGTPRNITSDGRSFLIGDENGSQPACWGGSLIALDAGGQCYNAYA